MFSPYYAWARRRGPADPRHYCCLNVALYGEGGKRWTMTERGRSFITRSVDEFVIGPSRLNWDGSRLEIQIDEIGAPIPARIRGTVRVYPEALTESPFELAPDGTHQWWPIAPCSHVEVTLSQPDLKWTGRGYLDSNHGTEPLERGFRQWEWSRTDLGRDTVIFYDAEARSSQHRSLAIRCRPTGAVESIEALPPTRLPTTFVWRVPRSTRSDPDRPATVRSTLEDTPFYARSLLDTHIHGERGTAFHESLSLDRFASRWVQVLLPFRMPRRGG
ncbi:MAG: carotenoid 1,2-hydratase [Geminicoccaceae bacterium]